MLNLIGLRLGWEFLRAAFMAHFFSICLSINYQILLFCCSMQYADDHVLYSFGDQINDCKQNLKKSISSLVKYFS